MKNTIENNLRVWDQQHHWSKDGDEWAGQACYCRQPYEKWKESLVEAFLAPNTCESSVVLEIGSGHGRWSKELAGRCRELILVDLSPNCIEFCRKVLSPYSHIRYVTNDGKALRTVEDNHVHFVWSFDCFVHMEKDVIGHYFDEIYRVLKPEGRAIIHHAGRNHMFLWLGFLRQWGRIGKHLYKVMTMARWGDGDGWRSNVSQQMVSRLAVNRGLVVDAQVQSWGTNNEFGVPRFNDFITILRKKEQSKSR